MADGASSAEDRPDDDSDFSRTSTTTGHRKRLDDDSDLGRIYAYSYRTEEAQLNKPDCATKGRTIGS